MGVKTDSQKRRVTEAKQGERRELELKQSERQREYRAELQTEPNMCNCRTKTWNSY